MGSAAGSGASIAGAGLGGQALVVTLAEPAPDLDTDDPLKVTRVRDNGDRELAVAALVRSCK